MTNNKKPSRQEMIQVIYKKIADKTLSFGCKFKLKTGTITSATGEPSGPFITCLFFQQTRLENIDKIIGHPVMIGDVMDYLDKLPNEKIIKILQETEKIFYIWQEKRKPIEEQSDECVEFVYNLISE